MLTQLPSFHFFSLLRLRHASSGREELRDFIESLRGAYLFLIHLGHTGGLTSEVLMGSGLRDLPGLSRRDGS